VTTAVIVPFYGGKRSLLQLMKSTKRIEMVGPSGYKKYNKKPKKARHQAHGKKRR
jgi:hypothetical protein